MSLKERKNFDPAWFQEPTSPSLIILGQFPTRDTSTPECLDIFGIQTESFRAVGLGFCKPVR